MLGKVEGSSIGRLWAYNSGEMRAAVNQEFESFIVGKISENCSFACMTKLNRATGR
jgi:hypothetical protein